MRQGSSQQHYKSRRDGPPQFVVPKRPLRTHMVEPKKTPLKRIRIEAMTPM